MSDSHISLGEDTQLLIVEDLDVDVDVEASGSDYLMPSSSLVGPFPNTNCSPPPLIGLDKPGPPNVALMNQSSTSRLSRSNSSSSSPALECAQSPTSCSSAAYITAVKSTYHKQLKKAYRMSPPSMAPLWPGLLASQLRHGSKTLADLSSPDLPDVDLDKMYLDVVTEDYKTAIKSLLPQLSISKMDPLSQVFCLRWNNHRNNLLNVLDNLLQTEAFCDVTLACDNTSIKCHKMILSACSAYFQKLFFEHPCDHPIVFLKDIKYAEIRAILDYMYKGEVNVAQEELPGLLKVAELLRVKGLVEEEREKLLNSNFIPGGGGSRGEGSGGKSHNSRSNEEPERSAKVNGGGTDHPSRNSVLAELRERERERDRERDRDRDRDRDRERERERERHRERVRSADAAVTKDSPPSTSTPVVPPMVRPFMYTPPPGAPSFPMFPIPGMFPGAQHLFGGSENDKDDSVGSHGAKRKKVASGSGGSSSSKESSGIGNNIKMDRDEHTGPNDLRVMDDKNQGNLSDSEKDSFMGLDKSGIANYVPNQRLEWKRYKQYTRNDIMAAIEEVKQGMSALQASRKYGVPSRTLYDKVKKMGITTGRQMQKKSLPNYPASFPQLGMLGMHESFKDADDREDTNDSSLGVPGDVTDGRATMVPPSGFSIQMLNLMKEMKDSNKSDLPINLSTMLSGVSSRDHNKRHSESSLSPRSPRGHYVGPEDEDEDIDDIDDDDQDREDGVDSSVRRRSRHSSGEIRAQFMADLKRLGGHIPYRAGSRGGSGDEPASSTTVSPPPTNTRLPVPPPLLHVPGEDSLPPRKRKVSQEHQLQQTPDDLTCSSTPYNGIHGNRNATNGGKGNESESSGMSSPEKQERMKDEPLSSPSLPCRN